MFTLASAGVEGSLVSVNSKTNGRHYFVSTPWLAGNSTVPANYEFVMTPIGDLPDTARQKQLAQKSTSTPGFSARSWKDLVDGIFALVFLAIAFSFSAWMFYAYTLKFASLGNLQLQETWQQFF